MRDRRRLLIFISVVVLVVLVIASLVLPPRNFPVNAVVDIPVGSSTAQIAALLYQNKIIRSTKIFEIMALRQEVAERLQAGLYQFEKPLTIGQVMKRLEEGLFSSNLVKFTVPEGLSVAELAKLAKQNFSEIDENEFVEIAAVQAGFLFPDTYLLPPQTETEQLIKVMREHFDSQIAKLKTKIESSKSLLMEIITMASLVEAEAKTKNDRQIIAGILWKRLNNKMRLEVDVATSTYEVFGLPPAPIVSPGLEAIEAVLTPRETPYWFYISDRDGEMHYAKTFEEHKLNIARYLK